MSNHSPAITPCLTKQDVAHFLNDSLSVMEQERIESHLDGCEACGRKLAMAAAPDSFWSESSAVLRSGSASHSRILAGTVDRAVSMEIPLNPSDEPEMMGRIGAYEICGVIGRGGMGVVFKGWDRSLDRYVAIKVMQPSLAHQSSSRHRFAREAKAAAGVVHDNVIAIYSVDEHTIYPYLVMPYVKGESLQRRIDRKAPLSLEEMLEIALQIARGLEAAHQQGLVHRDIKPANILLPESVSRVVITDFGLATVLDEASLTGSSALVGTPSYMSPEQIRGLPVDGRSDLFALGCTLYAMATGNPPFRAPSPYTVLRKITDEAHRPIQRIRHDLPRWFSELIDQLLNKAPQHRFTSAAELAKYLEDCLSHLRQPETVSLPRRLRQSKKLAWVIAVTSILVCGMAIFSTAYWWGDVGQQPLTTNNQDAAMQTDEDDSNFVDLQNDLIRIEEDLKSLFLELEQ